MLEDLEARRQRTYEALKAFQEQFLAAYKASAFDAGFSNQELADITQALGVVCARVALMSTYMEA